MARADLIVNLARAGAHGDRTLFRETLQAMIAEERRKQHGVLAERLERYLKNGLEPKAGRPVPPSGDDRVAALLAEVTPQIRLADLVLSDTVRQALEEVVEENQRRGLLQSYALEPRHRVLLVGPPGNGKTSVAHALADALMLPLFVVRYEGTVGSFLGETAARLGRLFAFVRTRACVLFFDEFDTLGKERGDEHDTGEIKRVVSSLLLQVDELPSHVVVVTATNHAELLDRAVWRRFQLRLHLPAPTAKQREEWAERLLRDLEGVKQVRASQIVDVLADRSFAELEEFALDVRRRVVLAMPSGEVDRILRDRMDQARHAARPRGG